MSPASLLKDSGKTSNDGQTFMSVAAMPMHVRRLWKDWVTAQMMMGAAVR